jgi:hypothetical protein
VDPRESWALVHRIVTRHEEALRRGGHPSIADALDGAGASKRRVLIELIHVELEVRLKSNEPARVDDYLELFPGLGCDREALIELLAGEWRIRGRSETDLDAHYLARFPDLYVDLANYRDQTASLEPTVGPIAPLSLPDGSDPPARALPSRFGRFELQELVGQGSFGLVYRAWDTVVGRRVAVKLPRHGARASPADVQTFLREARNASKLIHENIVPILEANTHEGTAYMVTHFVEGGTLADLLRSGPPPFEETARLMETVLDALHYAHESEKRVIHRDLKPSNILIDARGVPHITDFGLAQRDAGDGSTIFQTNEPLLVGTPAYMSPEQLSGITKRVDPRSDVWTAGVVLYQMLTGELPFRGRGRMLEAQIREGEPVSPRALNEAIPASLEAICLKALAKSPAGRYPSAREMADDIRRHRAGTFTQEGSPGRPGLRMRRAALRVINSHGFRYATLAGVILILAIALWMGDRENQSLRQENERLLQAVNQVRAVLP